MNNKKNKKKNNKWIRPRHTFYTRLVGLFLAPYTRLRYKIKIEKIKKKGQYLVLFNHQTAFDQFFVGISMRRPVYYVASEDLFSKGFVSKVIKHLVAPIPIKKQTTDVRAVLNCIKVAKEGGIIALAPEGNRTYSGKTEYMNPAIAPLARKLGLPIVLYRIEGGYGVHPRWSDVVRGGGMRAYIHRIVEKDEYSSLTDDELMQIIRDGLYVNEARSDKLYPGKRRAEYLERAMYVCPFCGLSEFESHGCTIECKRCGRKITYGENTELSGVGFEFPFKYVADWYAYQTDYVNSLDTLSMTDEPIYKDSAKLTEVIVYKKKQLIHECADISLYGDRIVFNPGLPEGETLMFSNVSAFTVLGKNKLNIYIGDHIYQLKGDKRFCALKYVNIFYRSHHLAKGELNNEFLGL